MQVATKLGLVAGTARADGAATSTSVQHGLPLEEMHNDESDDEDDEDFVPKRLGDCAGEGKGVAGDDGETGGPSGDGRMVTRDAREDGMAKEEDATDEEESDLSSENSDDSEDDLTADDGPGP
jgi:hypothetical protein